MMSRMHEKYRKETVPALMKRFGWKNMMAVPKIQKITLNIGLGEASQNAKLLDTAAVELGQITGQKPVITKAKKSIANFKIRKGMPIGCAVTLRGEKMYEFLDRLCNVVCPACATSAGCPPTLSMAAATTPWASRISWCSRKSITPAWTRSRA